MPDAAQALAREAVLEAVADAEQIEVSDDEMIEALRRGGRGRRDRARADARAAARGRSRRADQARPAAAQGRRRAGRQRRSRSSFRRPRRARRSGRRKRKPPAQSKGGRTAEQEPKPASSGRRATAEPVSGGALRPHEQAVLRPSPRRCCPTAARLPGASRRWRRVAEPAERRRRAHQPARAPGDQAGAARLRVDDASRGASRGCRRSGAAHIWRRSRQRARGSRHDLFAMLKSLVSLAYGQRAPQSSGSSAFGSRCERPGRRRACRDARRCAATTWLRPRASSSCDVVIVGSGAGGATVARTLAEAGLSVIVVEDGDYHDAATTRPTPSSRPRASTATAA